MGLGGGWEADVQLTKDHERQAREFLDAAEEIGANFFDHANMYGRGRAEEVFGRAMKERPSLRDKIVIQSKCGIRWADDPPGTPQRFDFSRDHILESVDAILARLRTDRLDILLLHRPDPLWEGEEIAEAFGKLHSAGKVRYFGVSNQNRFQMEYLQTFLPDPLVADQVEMSLLHHGFAEVSISFNQNSPRYPDGWEGTMEYCRMKSVLLQAWSPSGPGYLDGETRRSAREHKRDCRLGAKIRSTSRNHCRGHPAGVASQTSGEDPARVGNYPPGSIAVLCQGAFDLPESRGMVPLSLPQPVGTDALKLASELRSEEMAFTA